ncbi:MAG: hypothetical protein ACU85E_12445 [Gammaproteobacteria bacterium]
MTLLNKRDSLHGALVYGAGDSAAALMADEFQFSRMIGMMILGGSLYAIEIPCYFAWIERRIKPSSVINRITRALLAQAFFNPIWIARHILLIKCFSGRFSDIHWQLIGFGFDAFEHIFPFAFCVNYAIQNFIPLAWRFLASALFSASMAFYYALSEVLFV